MSPWVKVCCIQTLEEMHLATEAGATYAGLVGAMPSGPGPLDDEVIAGLAAEAPDGITPVLLTSRTEAADIVAHVRETGVRVVQIVRQVPASVRATVRNALPGLRILQVVHVQGPRGEALARSAAREADALLLDSGRPSAEVAELGGTGRVHDWAVSAAIARASPVPVVLAGGLHPGNVGEAIRTVRPAGVDVCTGIRDAEGRLVPGRLEAFMAAVRASSREDGETTP